MIKVTPKKSSKGIRLDVRNGNNNIFNHYYGQNSDAERAWDNFEKQIIEGKVEKKFPKRKPRKTE